MLGVIRQNVPEFNSDYSRREWTYGLEPPYEISKSIIMQNSAPSLQNIRMPMATLFLRQGKGTC